MIGNGLLSPLVDGLGTPAFGPVFFRTLVSLADLEQCTVFEFGPSARPKALIVEGRTRTITGLARSLAHEYIDGAYLCDPNLTELQRADRPLTRVNDPHAIYEPSYRERFYDRHGLVVEVVFLWTQRDRSMALTLYGSSSRRLDGNRALDAVRSDLPLLRSLISKHSELSGPMMACSSSAARPPAHGSLSRKEYADRLKLALLTGPGRLTSREAEVCARIVVGYSVYAISADLGMSMNTAATHRKRAYAKLGICSQNELFSLCLGLPAPLNTALIGAS